MRSPELKLKMYLKCMLDFGNQTLRCHPQSLFQIALDNLPDISMETNLDLLID